MISKETIDKIFDTIDIVEVIGEFVQLKKRGANYIGLSPFANERTPSFSVSPTKQIFKDFSSGKGGNAVHFLMEHEKFTYPEALRWLAAKYNIEIEEDKTTNVDLDKNNQLESLFIVNEYACKFFEHNLTEQAEGINIGVSYFKERGFGLDTIKKFQLGYCLDSWDNFTKTALSNKYKEEFLIATGLTIKKEDGKMFDRYKGRVIFPIHNLSGRVIGFGGRILNTDVKAAKYINSPESPIYHKSATLYGIFTGKNKIREENNCFLVEGYTDVISLHQAGIENVVASSGTSLTIEQIRLIKRFSNNITILYDGDPAGIKASLRGIDLILEEGLNVKIVLFPDGHDPDSYVRSVGGSAFKDYIRDNQQDFILFKTSVLLKDIQNDPLKKTEVIHEIITSISKIPDSIKVSLFVTEASSLLQINENILLAELNKVKLQPTKEQRPTSLVFNSDGFKPITTPIDNPEILFSDEPQERELIRVLISYGNEIWDENTSIAQFILAELEDVTFDNPLYYLIIEEIRNKVKLDIKYFTQHHNEELSQVIASMLSDKHLLSENWKLKHDIDVLHEREIVKSLVVGCIIHLKKHKVERMLKELKNKIKTATSIDEQIDFMVQYKLLDDVRVQLMSEFI